MSTLKENIEKKFEFDEKKAIEFYLEWLYPKHLIANRDECLESNKNLYQNRSDYKLSIEVLKKQNEQLKSEVLPVLLECVEALERSKKHCLCDRWVIGFDYHEEHRKLGRPKTGSRWLTPDDIIKTALERLSKWSENE